MVGPDARHALSTAACSLPRFPHHPQAPTSQAQPPAWPEGAQTQSRHAHLNLFRPRYHLLPGLMLWSIRSRKFFFQLM